MTLLSAVVRAVAPWRRKSKLLAHSARELKLERRGRMPEIDMADPLLTVSEVADRMRVSNMTVYRLIKSGQLAAIRVGKNYRLRGHDVERYLADRAVHIRAGE